MNAGMMVQSRDHVLIGSLAIPCLSTFASRRSSTWGPFFSDRLMVSCPDSGGGVVQSGCTKRKPGAVTTGAITLVTSEHADQLISLNHLVGVAGVLPAGIEPATAGL